MPPVAPLDPTFALAGPLESADFPNTLSARVVTPGDSPRLHGYDVETDLARHYDSTDLLCLSLTGDLPAPEASAALRVALAFFAPVSIAHASVHAATLARLCGGTMSATIGVAAIGLAEQARRLLDEHVELLEWLDAPAGEPPAAFRATTGADRASGNRLTSAIAETGLAVPELQATLTRNAALLCVLYRAGLKQRKQMEAAIVHARLPVAFAEAATKKAADFTHYPMKLPNYRYQETP
jgi:hypothetical protein